MVNQAEVYKISEYKTKESRARGSINRGKKGSIYIRNGKIWVSFYYLNQRVRESTGLTDTIGNRKRIRKILDLIIAEIDNNKFEFAKRFPYSKKRDYFSKLEGGVIKKRPDEIIFQDYFESWWREMQGGMSSSQQRDYHSIVHYHLLPYFKDLPFSAFNIVLMKKFLAHLKTKKNQHGNQLSAKRIQNIFIPLRVIVHDAMNEYGFDFPDPFTNIKLPAIIKYKVHPFTFDEWKLMLSYIPEWYKPYFEFAIQTGLRPSEQVALKKTVIGKNFIDIELSRVRNIEKSELKTAESRRRIEIRPTIRDVLKRQLEMSAHFNSPYVFINSFGRPIRQDKLREMWLGIIKKNSLPHRRMYETRHTFASWALAAGESPEWVAKTLGHVDTSMVYRIYGRYIPNLTRQDGSAFERQFNENQ